MRALVAFLTIAALLLAPATADANPRWKLILKQRVASEGPPDPPPTESDVVIPGVLTPAPYGLSNAAWEFSSGPGYQGDDYLTAFGGLQPAIGSWIVPQFLRIETPTRVGAVFRHLPTAAEWNNGAGVTSNIDHVEFSCDGGDAFSIDEETFSADTGVTAHHFQVTDAFEDGLHECRAIGIPTTGLPKLLQGSKVQSGALYNVSLFFFTNFDGTADRVTRYVTTDGVDGTDASGCGTTISNPCATIAKALRQVSFANSGTYTTGEVSNARICLGAGTFPLRSNSSDTSKKNAAYGWAMIDSCGPGGSQATTFLTPGTNRHVAVDKLMLTNLTTMPIISTNGTSSQFTGGTGRTLEKAPMMYVENVIMNGPGKGVRNSAPMGSDWNGGTYRRNSTFQNFLNTSGGNLSIGMTIDRNGADVFQSARLVMASTVTNADPDTNATGTLASASDQITDIVDPDGNIVPGFNVYNCTTVGGAKPYVSSVVGNVATMNRTCGTSATATELRTGAHADINQYQSGDTVTDVILIGNTLGPNNAQGHYLQADLTNAWLEDNYWSSDVPGYGGFIFKANEMLFTNVAWVRQSFLGGAMTVDGSPPLAGVDFAITDSTCGTDMSEATGVTYRNSASCETP